VWACFQRENARCGPTFHKGPVGRTWAMTVGHIAALASVVETTLMIERDLFG
jgi:hypothetical protein